MSIIGIAIGITTIVALGLITTGMEDSVQTSLNDVGAEITVSNSSSLSTNTGLIDSEIVDEMKNRTGVIDAAGSLTVICAFLRKFLASSAIYLLDDD